MSKAVKPNKTIKPVKGSLGKETNVGDRYRITTKHVHAATLLAGGQMNGMQICKKVGITYPQFNRWKRVPAFQEEVARQVAQFRNKVNGGALGLREKRIEMRDELAHALQYIRQQRRKKAKSDKELKEAGGLSGLVVQENVRDLRTGKLLDKKFTVDHPTVTQLRAIAMDQAKDVGDLNAPEKGAGVQVTIVLSKEEQGWL
jgi:hypothetical protein